jgi:hypothetical protein
VRMETHCLAGHVRLELRNVVAKYPFEKSHNSWRFTRNLATRAHSRTSCETRAYIRCAGQDGQPRAARVLSAKGTLTPWSRNVSTANLLATAIKAW